MLVEVLTFPIARTKSNVRPCRRACRSVNDNLAVLCSTISILVQSVLQALCAILSSSWSNNVGGSTSISFDVREQELELMVEHTQFFYCWQPSMFPFESFAYGTSQSCPG